MDGEKIDKLIILVSKYRELYVMSNKNYSNQNSREIIWSHIGKQINESGDVCKQRWTTLRDGFQRAARNNQTKSGQGAKGNKKWKYWDAMTFLLSHIKRRETHTNVTEDIQEQSKYEEGEDETETGTQTEIEYEANDSQLELQDISHDECDKNISLSSPISSILQPKTPLCSSSGSSISKSVSSAASLKKYQNPKKKIVGKTPESLPNILKEYIDDRKRSRLERQAKPVDAKLSSLLEFFSNMAKTTATFPPLWQAKVKSKVFEIVNSYELQLLASSSLNQIQPPTQNQPTNRYPMGTPAAMHNQVSMETQLPTHSTFSYYNQPAQGASTYYTAFGSQVSCNESSHSQNVIEVTGTDQRTATGQPSATKTNSE